MTRSGIDDYLYAVIMAGGSGTRFWPRSRKNRPKQLLNITGDEVLLKKAIQLMKSILPVSRIRIVTTAAQVDAVRRTVPEIPDEHMIIEPCGKNTAPAIGISALFLERDNPGAVMVILPADHYIEDEKKFYRSIMAGAHQASQGNYLVTIGIPPREPETGYGYIETDELIDKRDAIYSVQSFHEKPDLDTARVFISQGNFFWNSGIFIAGVSTILREISEYLPHHYRWLAKMRESLGREEESAVITEAYQNMEAISIDYGVIEKSRRVLMVVGDFGWNDVGSWPSAAQYWPVDSNNNAFIGELINLDSSQCIVYSPKKLVALLGVEDLVVVEEDDALLISKKGRSQDVRKLVEMLRSQGKDEIL
ncbi:MAG: mannose-1-phosphate guanylyltransferase [Deltaproteobacteria bacterium]|nr:MAG: mannose-1-phosphate guanylyltransferase [Deltaproteobacteria bacterium]